MADEGTAREPRALDGVAAGAAAVDLYLELLAKSLTHTLYAGSDAVGFTSVNPIKRFVIDRLERRGIVPVRVLEDGEKQRLEGRDWPLFGQTMVGLARLRNLRSCIESVVADGIAGDIIETGVWRGGASIYARGVLRAHGVTDRTVWAADSFQGLPPADGRYPADDGSTGDGDDHLAVSVAEVKANFERYGLLDDRVRFVEGWFSETLPRLRGTKWAVVRLDGDMYGSTMDGLVNLYPDLQPGGYLIVDDYSIDSCREAVTDFRRENSIEEPLVEIDWSGVMWRLPS